MTTIVWAEGHLYTDSRVTFGAGFNGKTHDDSFLKIREPEHFFYNDERVLAFTAAGDARIFTFFDFLSEHCKKVNQKIDVTDFDMYTGLQVQKIACSMMFITEHSIISVIVDAFYQLHFKRHEKIMRVATGSGYEKLGDLVFHGVLSGVDLMALAMAKDNQTGGPINVWSQDKGIVNNIPPVAHWDVMKKIMKHNVKLTLRNLFKRK